MTSAQFSITPAQRLIEQLQVYDTGLTKVRIGPNEDGGYVVLKELCEPITELYSYGIGNDVRFEVDFVTRFPNSYAYLFDHTIPMLPTPSGDRSNLIFLREGLGAVRTKDMDTLQSHIARAWHAPSPRSGGHRRMLKMDIEYGEWNVFERLHPDALKIYDQIICEFHIIPMEYVRTPSVTDYFDGFLRNTYSTVTNWLLHKYAAVIEYINYTHAIVHLHANNSRPTHAYGVYIIPELLEVTFARKSLLTEIAPFEGKLPLPGLDCPNKPWKDELKFYPWRIV